MAVLCKAWSEKPIINAELRLASCIRSELLQATHFEIKPGDQVWVYKKLGWCRPVQEICR